MGGPWRDFGQARGPHISRIELSRGSRAAMGKVRGAIDGARRSGRESWGRRTVAGDGSACSGVSRRRSSSEWVGVWLWMITPASASCGDALWARGRRYVGSKHGAETRHDAIEGGQDSNAHDASQRKGLGEHAHDCVQLGATFCQYAVTYALRSSAFDPRQVLLGGTR
jgi:hypothetical protein